MKYTIYMTEENVKQLEYEVISQELRVHLTRLIENNDSFKKFVIIHQNWIVNRSRNLIGETIYTLSANEYGYEDIEYAWHNGEFELSLRRLDSIRLIEILGDIIEREWLSLNEVNHLLQTEGASFRFNYDYGKLLVEVFPIPLEEESPIHDEHPNIRTLVSRMNNALDLNDFSAVLHSSACIFETLAKDVVGIPSIQDKTLGAFFERYKKDSKLPEDLKEKILEVYNLRNTTPLAGHGSIKSPTITAEEAITLTELTKAFVRIEYKLQLFAKPK